MNKRFFLLFVFLGLLIGVGTATAALNNTDYYYALDTGSGTTAVDSSANEYDGTITGATWLSSANAKLGNSALDFDGIDDYVSTPSGSFNISYSQMSVSAWVNLDVVAGENPVFNSEQANNFEVTILDGKATLRTRSSGTTEIAQDSTVLSAGTWYHIVGTVNHDTNTQKIYVNAVEQNSSATRSGDTFSSNFAEIGRRSDVGWFMDGRIDEVAQYERELNATEISDLYNSGSGFNPYSATASNFTLTVDSNQIVSDIEYSVNFTSSDGTTTYNYSGETGTLTTDILTNSTDLWNFTITADNHYFQTFTDYNVSNGSLSVTLDTTDTTPNIRSSERTANTTVSTTYATIDSFSFSPIANTTAYAVAQIQLTASFDTEGTCRITIDGDDYGSTTPKTIIKNEVENLLITTNDFDVNTTSNVTAEVECIQSGSKALTVEETNLIVTTLYNDIDNENISYHHENESSIPINTTWQVVKEWNFTTNPANLSNLNNNDWFFFARGTGDFVVDSSITTQLVINNNTGVCEVIKRYGTAGSINSWGTACFINGLEANTTYTAELYSNVSSGSTTINDFISHSHELQLPIPSINDSIITDQTINGVFSPITNISISNPIGGNYETAVYASINVKSTSITDTISMFISDGTSNLSDVSATVIADGNSNIFIIGTFPESGVGSVDYTLYGTCPNGCEIESAELVAYVGNQADVNPNEFDVTAHDFYSGSPINSFNVSVGGSTVSTTNGSVTIPYGDPTANVTVRSEGYFDNESFVSDTSVDYNASLRRWTAIYANAFDNSSYIDNFIITFEGTNYTATDNVTHIPLFNETANVSINATGYAIQTDELTASPYLENYTFELYNENTFNLSFFNETSNELLSGVNISIEFISDSNAFNASTSNGTYFVDLLTPDEYQIKYNIEGSEVIRNYYVTLSEQSYEEIDLYLIDEDISAYYVANVVDASSNACQQNTVSLLRYYVSVNQYKTVEMSQTNSQGQAVFRVKPNNVDYKFFFSGTCGDFTSAPTRLIDSSNSYTITGGQELLESLYAISGASTSLTYVNATETFAYSWTSDSNIITQGCLTVQKRKDGVRTTVGTQCATGNTGTASITINDTNETTYFASGKLFTSTTFSDSVTNDLEVSFITGFFDNANYAPFAALLIFVAVVLAMGVSASGLVVGSVAALIGLSFFSFIQISTATIFGFITIGVAILYLARGRGA